MPNTPALIGQGIAGLFARPASADERTTVEAAARTGGRPAVGAREDDLDAVTALSARGRRISSSSSRP
jgi:pyrroline-5-carboxylate reductase